MGQGAYNDLNRMFMKAREGHALVDGHKNTVNAGFGVPFLEGSAQCIFMKSLSARHLWGKDPRFFLFVLGLYLILELSGIMYG